MKQDGKVMTDFQLTLYWEEKIILTYIWQLRI